MVEDRQLYQNGRRRRCSGVELVKTFTNAKRPGRGITNHDNLSSRRLEKMQAHINVNCKLS